MRDFDPVRLGGAETDAWVCYYLRRWRPFLRASVTMVRVGFGLPWPDTIRGAWWVLRANQAWAPLPDNDPAAARAYMRRFYALVGGRGGGGVGTHGGEGEGGGGGEGGDRGGRGHFKKKKKKREGW